MAEPTRPKQVVVVDAENPMEEIHGEFYWREDHEQLLTRAADAAFREGYRQGWSDHVRNTAGTTAEAMPPVTSQVRRRVRYRWPHLVGRGLVVLVVLAYAVTLIGSLGR